MRERPILMSAPMVRALLNGTKTQTRRVAMHTVCGVRVARLAYDPAPDVRACPYGVPGDRLWVRETWAHHGACACYRADGWAGPPNVGYEVTPTLRWRPSIHMPRWASRLTLRITGVRVERLQDITPEDCRAEGHPMDPARSPSAEVHDDAALDWYRDLWDSLNAARGYGWDANPWVWVVAFERVVCFDDCPPGHCACDDGDARTVKREVPETDCGDPGVPRHSADAARGDA